VKKYILFDHDGVLVDTEFWYYKAGERALADVGLALDKDQYLRDMNRGLGTWAQARAAGIDEQTIGRQREARDDYYQEYLRTEAIEIEGVIEALAELSQHARMAIVTTAKRADFELIHEKRHIRQFMDFVLVREDYGRAKPHPRAVPDRPEALRSHQGRDTGRRGLPPRAEVSRGGRHRLCHRPQRLYAFT
jgi:beta-phosphoglucomutase-like phosphatase (HAD superfamily)